MLVSISNMIAARRLAAAEVAVLAPGKSAVEVAVWPGAAG